MTMILKTPDAQETFARRIVDDVLSAPARTLEGTFRTFVREIKTMKKNKPTFLIYVLRLDDIDLLRLLVQRWRVFVGPDTWAWHVKRSLFHVQSVAAAALMVECGACVHAQLKCRTTPLFNFVRSGRIDLVLFMVFKLANMEIRTKATSTSASNTPLTLAAACGNIDMCAALIDAGADINGANFNGDTALHVAVRNHDPPLARFLLGVGADPLRQNVAGHRPRNMCTTVEMKNTLMANTLSPPCTSS